jgi:hypothetical protein
MVGIHETIEERYQGDHWAATTQRELGEIAQKRTASEVAAFKHDSLRYTAQQNEGIKILHISDLHLGTAEEARQYRVQLEADLRQELGIRRLDYLVITGDVANRATPEEYAAAFDLVDGLVKRFGLDEGRVVVVPGNHDLNWKIAQDAYTFVHTGQLATPPPAGRYIPAGAAGVLLRDEERYARRFEVFSEHFYERIHRGYPYPPAYAEQSIAVSRADDRILFLALNSAWEIDHEYRRRAGIHRGALARALDELLDGDYDGWIKIAVWHHPVTGPEAMSADFLEQLAVHGFRLCLHGHVHEAREGFYRYDNQRGLHIVGAGTFGAPAHEQVAGIPLQYNLLMLAQDRSIINVATRKKERADGAWSADARWGDRNAPIPRYTVRLG